MTKDTIGVDISKDHLDAHRMSDGANRRFTNDTVGHRAFMDWLGQTVRGFNGLKAAYCDDHRF